MSEEKLTGNELLIRFMRTIRNGMRRDSQFKRAVVGGNNLIVSMGRSRVASVGAEAEGDWNGRGKDRLVTVLSDESAIANLISVSESVRNCALNAEQTVRNCGSDSFEKTVRPHDERRLSPT
jgi:hypothetical protein